MPGGQHHSEKTIQRIDELIRQGTKTAQILSRFPMVKQGFIKRRRVAVREQAEARAAEEAKNEEAPA